MTEKTAKIRVLISKIGLDTHVMGAKIIAYTLKEAGMEVIYLGKYQTPELIVQSALEEDVDVIGLSCLASNYKRIFEVLNLLKENDMKQVLVLAGGTIPRKHADMLKEAGVSEVFFPNTNLQSVVNYINSHVKRSVCKN
jgi:methylmalonyl-CoA mutase C-terminal domain/subunit